MIAEPTGDPFLDAAAERAIEREHRDRVLAAGVSPRLAGFTFDRIAWAEPTEAPLDFVDRFLAEYDHETTLGLLPSLARVVGALSTWRPESGRWLYLEGEPGAGKSALLAALVRKLLAEPRRAVPVTIEEVRKRDPRRAAEIEAGRYRLPRRWVGGYSVRFVLEHDLQVAHDAHRRSRDQGFGPLHDAAQVDVLVLDDLGTADRDRGSWRRDVEALVDARYKARRPTVISSNVPLSEVGTVSKYASARLSSRLSEVVGRPLVVRVGFDWRRVLGKLAD